MSNNVHNNQQNSNGNCTFIRAVEEAFFLLKQNHHRSINSDDFCAVAKSIGIDLDNHEVASLIRTAHGEQVDDHSHETELTADQYSALMLRYVGSAELDDELRRTFDAFDRDHDGKITRKDMDKLRHETHFFDQLDDEQYELVLNELLRQGTNGMNYDQFVYLMMHQ